MLQGDFGRGYVSGLSGLDCPGWRGREIDRVSDVRGENGRCVIGAPPGVAVRGSELKCPLEKMISVEDAEQVLCNGGLLPDVVKVPVGREDSENAAAITAAPPVLSSGDPGVRLIRWSIPDKILPIRSIPNTVLVRLRGTSVHPEGFPSAQGFRIHRTGLYVGFDCFAFLISNRFNAGL
jgi:hypothetical protein